MFSHMVHLLCCNIGDHKKSSHRGPNFLWADLHKMTRLNLQDTSIVLFIDLSLKNCIGRSRYSRNFLVLENSRHIETEKLRGKYRSVYL